MILDGYGLNERKDHNAVAEAKTPVMDKLMAECPFVKGNASGMAVGLPEGQMGNSEVGHMNMGAGRIVYQELTRITKSIEDGDFFENEELLGAIENCKKNNSDLINNMGNLTTLTTKGAENLEKSLESFEKVETPHGIEKSLSKTKIAKRYLKHRGIKDEGKKKILIKVLKDSE